MIKKSQLALILLTLVMMLAVYYIKSPFKGGNEAEDPDATETTGRLQELSTMRLTLNNERTQEALSYDAIIADTASTVEQKEKALNMKKSLNEVVENELLLELEIINKGYRDALVHATTTGIDVTVVAEEHSAKVANEVILMTLLKFEGINNVKVNFQTAAEVMGRIE